MRAALGSCCGSGRWSARIAAHRPYPDTAAVLAAADEAFWDLAREDLAEAMADERSGQPDLQPTPGEEIPGGSAARLALREAHDRYRQRFGRPFLMSLDEFPPEEALDQLLHGLRVRLDDPPEQEWHASVEELRKLALGRLRHLLEAAGSGA